jgi:endonuclease/exonuclease/phosphatase (EEP) superfamily protein YafD
MGPAENGSRWIGKVLFPSVLALAGGSLVPAHAAAEDQEPAATAPARNSPRLHDRANPDDGVKTLSQALGLDAQQQAELRKVLEGQREKTKKVWADTTLPAAHRIGRTQAISDQTAELIRALLTEEQKKKYMPPRMPHTAATASSPSVEDWMNRARPK